MLPMRLSHKCVLLPTKVTMVIHSRGTQPKKRQSLRHLLLLGGLTTAVFLLGQFQTKNARFLHSNVAVLRDNSNVSTRRTPQKTTETYAAEAYAGSIPTNLLFNSKDGIDDEHFLLQENINRYVSLFPEWDVIQDSDASCLEKILSINVTNSISVKQWYTSDTTPGMFKSDLCRLAQLWLHGGTCRAEGGRNDQPYCYDSLSHTQVSLSFLTYSTLGIYFDNDLTLEHSLLPVLNEVDIVTAIAWDRQYIFQAILGSPPKHPLIKKSLQLTRDWIEGKVYFGPQEWAWLGPYVLAQTMKEHYSYNASDFDPHYFQTQRVFLLKEVDSSHLLPPERMNDHNCNVGLVDGNETHYGYSRVKQGHSWRTKGRILPCEKEI
jgi:hypothetical protein